MSNLSNLSPKEEVALTAIHVRGGAVEMHQIPFLRGVSQQPPFFLPLPFRKILSVESIFEVPNSFLAVSDQRLQRGGLQADVSAG